MFWATTLNMFLFYHRKSKTVALKWLPYLDYYNWPCNVTKKKIVLTFVLSTEPMNGESSRGASRSGINETFLPLYLATVTSWNKVNAINIGNI